MIHKISTKTLVQDSFSHEVTDNIRYPSDIVVEVNVKEPCHGCFLGKFVNFCSEQLLFAAAWGS